MPHRYRPAGTAPVRLLSVNATADDTAPAKTGSALEPVTALDVSRNPGTRHEIARYPDWFQRLCIGRVAQTTHSPATAVSRF